jgi:hypothetical protein
LLFPLSLQKVAVPNGPAEQAGVVPTLDVTYLDDGLRVRSVGWVVPVEMRLWNLSWGCVCVFDLVALGR